MTKVEGCNSNTSLVDFDYMANLYFVGASLFLLYGLFSQFFVFIEDPLFLRLIIFLIIFLTGIAIKYSKKMRRFLDVSNLAIINLLNFYVLYIIYLNDLSFYSVFYFGIYVGIISLLGQYAFTKKNYLKIHHGLFFGEFSIFILFFVDSISPAVFFLVSLFVFLMFSYFISVITIDVKNNLIDQNRILEFVIDNSPMIFFVLDEKRNFLISKGQALENLGLEQDQAVGMSVYDLYGDYPLLLNQIEGAYQSPFRGFVEVENRIFDTYWAPFQLEGNKIGLMGEALDITERIMTERNLKEKESQINKIQKLEVVGKLASSIAHDFNNLLSIVSLNSELITIEKKLDMIYKHNKEIMEATDQASYLTKRLLTITQRDVEQPLVIEVNEKLEDLKAMLRRIVPENIEISFIPSDTEIYTYMDQGQFEQIFINLFLNSKDAIPKYGKITVAVNSLPNEDVFKISVHDNGAGISKDQLQHVFEPFWTTKKEGTGLGLYSVKNTIENFGGYIKIQSKSGEGTTIEIFLLKAQGDDEDNSEEEDMVYLEELEGELTLLLVEDNLKLQESVKEVLEKYNIRVLSAGNGSDGWELFENNFNFDILITDILLPKMNGFDLAEMCLMQQPDLRIIFMSGYTESIDDKYHKDDQFIFMKKPFSMNSLMHHLNDLLEAKSSALHEHHTS